MGAARFGKVVTAMVTPFQEDGALDLDGAAELARWLVAHGNDGLVLTGTTGEGPTLTDDEAVEVWTAVRAAVDVPLLAGTGSNSTRHTVALSERAAATGVDGLLAHMRAVAESVDLPVVLYDVPGRTGRALSVDTIVELATEVPNIVGLKDARGLPTEAAQIVARVPDSFDVYSGDDGLTLPLLAVGAAGVVGVATHWTGPLFGEMISAFEKGDVVTAREVNARLLDSFSYEATDLWQHATGVKALLTELGLPGGPSRLPLAPIPDEARSWARRIIEALEVTR